MARPLRIQYPNAYYHLVCQGNERREIFYSDEDQTELLDLLCEDTSFRGYNTSWTGMIIAAFNDNVQS